MNKNKFNFSTLLNRIFNRSNLNKILIIFIVGFTSRVLINYIYNINVFVDYFNKISIVYYISMSLFTVIIHEVITYFNINIIPSYVFDCCCYTRKLIYNSMNTLAKVFIKIKEVNSKIFNNISLKDFSISSIKDLIKNNTLFHNSNKLSLSVTERNKLDIKDTINSLNSNTLSRSSTSGSRNSNNSTNSNNSRNIADRRINRTNDNRENVRSRNNITSSVEHNDRNNVSQENNGQSNTGLYGYRESRVRDDALYFDIENIRNTTTELPIRSPNPEASNQYSYTDYSNQNSNSYNESNYTTSQTPNEPVYYPYDPNEPIPSTLPSAPNPYNDLPTPSSSAPTFRTHQSESSNYSNNQPLDTYQKTSIPEPSYMPANLAYHPTDKFSKYATSNYNNRPITSIDNSDNRYSTNGVASSYRNSYYLPTTTYAPTTDYVSTTTYAYNNTHNANNTIPVTSTQGIDQPVSTAPYTDLANSNELPRTRALIDNPRVRPSYVESNDVDWANVRWRLADNVRNKIQEEIIQDSRKHSSKIPVNIPSEEVIVPKKGLMGKLKLGFKYLDAKMHNVDTVYVIFRDKSKRKFIWTLWEKKSGMYESYEDFKNSWDPNTSVWSEIKSRTHKDMRMDIENILGVSNNRGALGNTTTNTIQPAPHKTTEEVRNLMRKKEPFKDKINNTTQDVQFSSKHKHKYKDNHGHHSRTHGRPDRNHGESSSSRRHGNYSHNNNGHSSRSYRHGHSRSRRNQGSSEYYRSNSHNRHE